METFRKKLAELQAGFCSNGYNMAIIDLMDVLEDLDKHPLTSREIVELLNQKKAIRALNNYDILESDE